MPVTNALIDPRLAGALPTQAWTSPRLELGGMESAYSMPLTQNPALQPPRVLDEGARSPLPLMPFRDGANEPMDLAAPYNRDAWNALATQRRFGDEMTAWNLWQLYNRYLQSRP